MRKRCSFFVIALLATGVACIVISFITPLFVPGSGGWNEPMTDKQATVMFSLMGLGLLFFILAILHQEKIRKGWQEFLFTWMPRLKYALLSLLLISIVVALCLGISYIRLRSARHELEVAVVSFDANSILAQYDHAPERLSRAVATSNLEVATATVRLLVQILYDAPPDTCSQVLHALMDFHTKMHEKPDLQEQVFTLSLAEELYTIAANRQMHIRTNPEYTFDYGRTLSGELIYFICDRELLRPWKERVSDIAISATSCSKVGDYRPAMPIENIAISKNLGYPLKINERIERGELGPSAVQRIIDSIRCVVVCKNTTSQVGVYVPVSPLQSGVSSEPGFRNVLLVRLIDLDQQCVTAESELYGSMPPAQITRTYPKPTNVMVLPATGNFPGHDEIRKWLSSLPDR